MCLTNWETSEPTLFFTSTRVKGSKLQDKLWGRGSIFQERDLKRERQISKPRCSFCGKVKSLQRWMPSSSTEQIYTRESETESQTEKNLCCRKQEQAVTSKAELSPDLSNTGREKRNSEYRSYRLFRKAGFV